MTMHNLGLHCNACTVTIIQVRRVYVCTWPRLFLFIHVTGNANCNNNKLFTVEKLEFMTHNELNTHL